jgi:hypothetical protein
MYNTAITVEQSLSHRSTKDCIILAVSMGGWNVWAPLLTLAWDYGVHKGKYYLHAYITYRPTYSKSMIQ